MRVGTIPKRDPREQALADVYLSRLQGADPRRAALADLSDPLNEMSESGCCDGDMDEDMSDYADDPTATMLYSGQPAEPVAGDYPAAAEDATEEDEEARLRRWMAR